MMGIQRTLLERKIEAAQEVVTRSSWLLGLEVFLSVAPAWRELQSQELQEDVVGKTFLGTVRTKEK